jgi:NAD(P)H-flavin reductase/ferredoxin
VSAGGFRIRLEPLGEEIDCGADETVLDAAFRQGYNLAYGCREGQCSACKCYLLDGELDLKPYSSFALSDAERGNGYALMCRTLPLSDLTIELLHYDPDNYRLENAIREVEATVTAVTELTHDITGLTLRVDEDFGWLPGQYVDVHIPGGDGARRSFSIANLPGTGEIQLMIRRYPGGRFSSLLGNEIESDSHSHLQVTGPYGAFHLRRSERPILMIAGGSGMAPVLGVLRQLAGERCERPVRFFYGAREDRDLFMLDEIAALGERLADFRFTPVTGRFVHEAVDDELAEPDVYMCGPPPMLEACEEMLVQRGVDPARIFQDRFTRSAGSAGALPGDISQSEISAAVTNPGVNEPRAKSEREFAWFAPAGRRATLYEDVTIDTQPSIHRHLARGWPLSFADGRGTWNDASTALTSDDWFAFRDPGQQWERPFYQAGAAVEAQLESALASAAEQGLIDDFAPEWVRFLQTNLQIPAFVEHGLWFALATAARDCLSDSVATCVCLQAAHKQRSAQAIVLYAMDLERRLGTELPITAARQAFLTDPAWQPTRRYLERLAATPDWGEVLIAANLCFEPTVGTLIRRELGTRRAAASGDVVTPVLARAATQEWEWARTWTVALVRFLMPENRTVIDGWVADWMPQALAACAALNGDAERVRSYADTMLAEALSETPRAVAAAVATVARDGDGANPGGGGPGTGGVGPGPRGGEPSPGDGRTAPDPEASSDGSYDYVGIVMAKSAEGDAVARVFSGRAEVIEQPAFWEIRARDRLVIPYDDVAEELGYEIDAYSIQHEMSTHYGRMVATDDALMLFSDPTEAMEHLLS